MRRDLAGTPVVLVRGADGEVRAFVNACRHRGAPVVSADAGCARLLVCQYHSSGVRPRGAAPGTRARRARLRGALPRRPRPAGAALRTLGWLVVRQHHDPQAVPLLEWLDPLPDLLAGVADSPLRVVKTDTVELGCNWKILAEGFLEVYPPAHDPSHHGGPHASPHRGTVISLFDHGHQNMLSPVKPGTRNERARPCGRSSTCHR